MTTKIAAVLAAGLLLAGCGESSTPGAEKSEQGVRDAYAQFAKLVKEKKGDEACKQYMTTAARTLAEGFGGCGQLLNENGDEITKTDATKMPVTVNGDTAKYTEADGTKGNAVYDGKHWRFDLSD